MTIAVADEQRRLKLPIGKIRALVGNILRGERRAMDLSFAFVTNRAIHALNRRFLLHDFVTDVLAFPLDGRTGEIVISTDYAAAEAKRRRIPPEEELLRYVAHGVLHLLGYDDHAPAAKKRMWAKQERYLRL
jgi:probable rRNA maturation factor